MEEKKTAQIKQWENYMLKLQDTHFFDVIRAYTGAIKTPFNKHDLLSRLVSFLKQKEIQESIFESLSYDDVTLLTAIYYLKAPSLNTLMYYLYPTTKKSVLAHAINLQERLLIYRADASKTDSDIAMLYSINPVLQEALLPYLNIPFLIPYEEKGEKIADDSLLPPAFFSLLYSYIYNNSDMFKKEGTLKKKVYTNLINLCPAFESTPELIHEIIYTFSRLGMLNRHGSEGMLVEPQWKKFATLTHYEKLIYLTVASGFYYHLLNEDLNIAEVFNELLHTLQKGAWYLDTDVYSLFYLIYKKHKGENTTVDFDRDDDWFYCPDKYPWSIDQVSIDMIYQAERFKVLIRQGELLAVNEALFDIVEEDKPLLISNTFEVTISRNAKFSTLLHLLPGMKAGKLLTFASFEFSRITCEKLFQKNLNADDICTLLEVASPHEIPQNVRMSIQQWYESYSLVGLYFGYVLCVDEKKRQFFQKDAPLASFVKKEIAEGVYLLNAEDAKEVDAKLKKVGVDFISFVKNVKFEEIEETYSALPEIKSCVSSKHKQLIMKNISKRTNAYVKKQVAFIDKLKTLAFDKDITDALFNRIDRKVIITDAQINPDTLNNLPRKAEGMDFTGKIKVLEEAKTNRQTVAIVMNDKERIEGQVADLWKSAHGSQCVEIITEEPGKRYRVLNVSKIQELQIIIESIFS